MEEVLGNISPCGFSCFAIKHPRNRMFNRIFFKKYSGIGVILVWHLDVYKRQLPSFTQTALLHVNGRLVDRKKLDLYLGIYQTSSPSYVLMAGMDECMRRIDREGKQLFSEFAKRLDFFYERVLQLKRIKVAGKWLIGEAQINDFEMCIRDRW